MATKKEEYTEVLFRRFRKVPNIMLEDCEVWLEAAMIAEGITDAEQIPADRLFLVLLLAQAEGARDVAMSTAHFFNYTDGDEVVDKSMISSEWRQIESGLRAQYMDERSRRGTVTFRAAKRLDRDQ